MYDVLIPSSTVQEVHRNCISSSAIINECWFRHKHERKESCKSDGRIPLLKSHNFFIQPPYFSKGLRADQHSWKHRTTTSQQIRIYIPLHLWNTKELAS